MLKAIGAETGKKVGQAKSERNRTTQKFEYKFDSLPYNEVNEKRVRDVLSKATATNYSLQRHESGCVLAVVYLPSFMQFMTLEMLFRTEGLRS